MMGNTVAGGGILVETPEGLKALVERLKKADVIGVDTEFHSEKRYWPELFLIQVSDREGCMAIDPLALEDLSSLKEVFQAEKPVKIIHSSRNDIDVLAHHLDTDFNSVFDTQLAGAFTGAGEQSSLFNLVQSVCGISTGKGHTLSDWSIRPLSDEQLRYALDDVRYLHQIYDSQMSRLRSSGRLKWYEAEIGILIDSAACGAPLRKIFRKARSAGKVRKPGLPLLWNLVKWRERTAMQFDKPRNFILKDYTLSAAAAMQPRNLQSLERLRGVSSGFMERWGREILEIVRTTATDPPKDVPRILRSHSAPGASARKQILRIFLLQESVRLGIAPSLLLPKEVLDRIASDPPVTSEELHSLEGIAGWRTDALGEDLISLLKGDLALCLKRGRNSGLKFVRMR